MCRWRPGSTRPKQRFASRSIAAPSCSGRIWGWISAMCSIPMLRSAEDGGTRIDLNQTWIAQPALFVIEYALAQLWMSWGVRPWAMIGHSLGEYVAACLAGVFSLEDALVLVAGRGRLMQQQPSGAMLAVPLAEDELRPLLGGQLDLAAVNAPIAVRGIRPTRGDQRAARTARRARDRWSHTAHLARLSLGGDGACARPVCRTVPKHRAASATDPLCIERHRRMDHGGRSHQPSVLGPASPADGPV